MIRLQQLGSRCLHRTPRKLLSLACIDVEWLRGCSAAVTCKLAQQCLGQAAVAIAGCLLLDCEHKGRQVCCRLLADVHVSYAAAVLCASVAARLPSIQQIVFSQHTVLLDSGNAPWFTVRLTAAAVHNHQHALRMLTCPCHRVFAAVTNSKKGISPTGISGFACIPLQQLGIMIINIVVVAHSVLQAESTSSGAPRLLNWIQEAEMHES